MSARFIVADVFDGLATLEDGSVDLVVTSPPFLALRSYLPADHPDKGKEIGSEATPAEFIDTLLRVTQELRRVLAPHGSIAIELGDTYAGSGGAGGDYDRGGLREGQPRFRRQPPNTSHRLHDDGSLKTDADTRALEPKNLSHTTPLPAGPGWPLAKSTCMIPESYRWALAYGMNPFTGQPSPAGMWRVRNVVTWCRPNPPVGALGDKWRPATSDVVVACVSGKRYWDDLATRKENPRIDEASLSPRAWAHDHPGGRPAAAGGGDKTRVPVTQNRSGAPLLDYWEIPPTGYAGAHYAVYPADLVVPLVKAMCPEKVCRTCGEPSRRITETNYERSQGGTSGKRRDLTEPDGRLNGTGMVGKPTMNRVDSTLGWSDCGHDDYRPGLVLDPFAGSGTTLAVATGHGRDAIGIDLDERNADLAMERVGPFLMEVR